MNKMTDLRVLIADDERPMLDLISRILGQFDVVCKPEDRLPSCGAAIERYRQDNNYHLVFTDLNQSPSGVDVVKTVRECHGSLDTRVAIVTAGSRDGNLLRDAQKVADFFLEKPFTREQFREIVEATKKYFARVGVNPAFPKQWYVDNSSPPMLVLGVEGTADDVKLSIERFKSESGLQVDWSPIMPKSSSSQSWTLTIGNVYVPDVCTFQIGQDVPKGDEKPYTSIVSTGIGQVVTDLMKEFIAKSNLVVKSPGIPFVMQTEMDQSLFKLSYFGLLQALKDPELAKRALVENLRIQQGEYKSLQN